MGLEDDRAIQKDVTVSAIQKAQDFIELLKENDWKGDFKFDEDTDYAWVRATRKAEVLEIAWSNNQLNYPPRYTLAGVESNLHHAGIARRVVTGNPDLHAFAKRVKRRARAAQRQQASPGTPQQNSSSALPQVDTTQHELPFDVNTSSDKEILMAIRGSTLTWRNRMTGEPELCFVPRESNRDLNNVFYIAESSSGSVFVSFMDAQGTFRAVALDAILQVG